MVEKLLSSTFLGTQPFGVVVEVDVKAGFPSFTIVGLADKSIDESRERVRSAIMNSKFQFPTERITVNLSPADLPKQGPTFDLPIALGIILANSKPKTKVNYSKIMFLGELSLNGELVSTSGVLLSTIFAKSKGFETVIIPEANLTEASLVEGIEILGAKKLADVVSFLMKGTGLTSASEIILNQPKEHEQFHLTTFGMVKGQEIAKRALLIAASGGHNVHLKGPAGSGKTMLAKAMVSILPPLTHNEKLEVTSIYSTAGELKKQTIGVRPFRSPHHTISQAGLIGGGSNPKVGEITLAHQGVLFLDEFAEYSRSVLESLRQPMEDGVVTISRAKFSLTYPTNFTLIAASNPCPCGNYGVENRTCRCSASEVRKYKNRLSGPIMDRIDIHVSLPPVSTSDLLSEISTTNVDTQTKQFKDMVASAREIGYKRNGKGRTNSDMSSSDVEKQIISKLTNKQKSILEAAQNKFNLSARSVLKVLKVSRTIADLELSNSIEDKHIYEALQFRPKLEEF